jgi:hypothetical protein
MDKKWRLPQCSASSGVFLVLKWMILEKVLGVAALWGRPCIGAKPTQWQIWMGWLAPYSGLGPTVAQTKG